MKALFALAKPFLHGMDPEDAHAFTVKSLQHMPVFCTPKADPILQQTVFGLEFAHPLGLAAGFDKQANVIRAMLGLGMGHVEVGTVTPLPQDGNPRPRIFRSARDRAVINRMGFPNPGADVFFENLHAYRHNGTGIVGVNIGKNKDTENALLDYAALAMRCNGVADYVTINISSPNTPGLRDLQNGDFLRRCVEAVRNLYGGPVLVKLAPDLLPEQLKDLADAAVEINIDGVILTNTTLDRPAFLDDAFAAEKGGLSGAPLKDKALETLRAFYSMTGGKIPLVGAGGIDSAKDAYMRVRAGASLVQVYSALVFHGPGLIKEIVHELPVLLRKGGFTNIAEAVGADHR